MNASDVRAALEEEMALRLDSRMWAHEFTRRNGSMAYLRSNSECTQSLDLVFDLAPTYEPRSLAHVLPDVVLFYPSVNRVCAEMFGSDISAIPFSQGTTFRAQLSNIAPKERYVPWYVYGDSATADVVESIWCFVDSWAVSFFDDYYSVSGLVSGFEANDDRLRAAGRPFYLFVVAAYIVLNKPGAAMQILENRFGKAMLRRKYAAAFDYVAKLAR